MFQLHCRRAAAKNIVVLPVTSTSALLTVARRCSSSSTLSPSASASLAAEMAPRTPISCRSFSSSNITLTATSALCEARRWNTLMDVKPFQCSICHKAFRLEGAAKTHLAAQHGGSGEVLRVEGGGAAAPPQQPVSAAATTPQNFQQQQTMHQQQQQRSSPIPSPSSQHPAGTGAPVPPVAQPRSPPQQQQQQPASATTPASSTAPATAAAGSPPRRLQQADPATATRFATMQSGKVVQSGSSHKPERFHVEIQRQKVVKPLTPPWHVMPDDAMAEMLAVWDKYGVARLGAAFKRSDQIVTGLAGRVEEDPDQPTYATAQAGAAHAPNPFLKLTTDGSADAAAVGSEAAASTASTTTSSQPPQQEQDGHQQRAAATSDTTSAGATSTATAAEAEVEAHIVATPVAATTTTVGGVFYSVCTAAQSPFVCAPVVNPFVINPGEPPKPVILNPTLHQQIYQQKIKSKPGASAAASSSASSTAVAGQDDQQSSDAAAAESADDDDDDGAPLSMAATGGSASGNPLEAPPSAFAAAMQATSPFSVTESGAPLDSPVVARSASFTSAPLVGAAAAAASSASLAALGATTVPSPFGAAVAAFAASVLSSYEQQQQATQAQQQTSVVPTATSTTPTTMTTSSSSNTIISPFANMIPSAAATTTPSQPTSTMTSTTTTTSTAGGAPLSPVEAAVDLSALFGTPGSDFQQQQQKLKQQGDAAVFTCAVCGKNTFKSESSLAAHCETKHNIKPDAASKKTSQQQQQQASKPKERTLPDLPPYIPTPVDLGATAPYGTVRAKPGSGSGAAVTAMMWSDVELAPHARVFSSMTLLGEVTAVERGFVMETPVLQLSVYIAASQQDTQQLPDAEEEEEIVVRCFGADLVEHLASSVFVGCSVLVEGTLRMNPSYDSQSNRYFANPVVHVAAPNGLVQRLD